MNILVLCHEYPPLGGGGGVGAKQYAEAWASKGHRVTVLTSWSKGLRFNERINDVDVIRIFTFGIKNRATATFISMFSYIVFGFFYVLLHRREFQSNHVVNTHFSIPTGPLGILISKVLGLPNVLTIIGGDIYDPTKKSSPHRNFLMRATNSFIINSASRVVAISSDTKSRAERYYSIRKDIEVINYGFIPINLVKENHLSLNRENGEYYLIAVGRLVKRKGFECLIHSMKLLPSEIILLIVGDGPMEDELKNLTAKDDLSDRVIFLGYRTRDEIYEYLQNSDCFVLSSVHEGLGIVVQEAMYAGLPIVSTNNGGQTDLIKDPRNGILVEPGDVVGMSAAIHKFYSNREIARETGANNKEDIRHYYMATNAELYVNLFKELVGLTSENGVLNREAPKRVKGVKGPA